MIVDYSQSGEQEIVAAVLAELGIEHGTFLDIGAGDGMTFSNTRALGLAGWEGVAVEPAAWAFDRLVEMYRGGGVRVVQAAVTAEQAGLVPFFYARDDHVSTTSEAEMRKWQRVVPFAATTVAAVPLADVLDYFALGASVVSIDAEGRTNEIVAAYLSHPAWEDVRVLVYERDAEENMALAPPFEYVAATPNNLIYRRPA